MVRKVEKSELLKLTACACGNLRSTARSVTQLFDEIFQPLGLRSTQFSLLIPIDYLDSITISELAEFFEMDRTTLTRNLGPLERDGYITFVAGEDRRTRIISLTEKGRDAVADGMPLWEKAQATVVQGIGEDRFLAMLSDLADISAIARNES